MLKLHNRLIIDTEDKQVIAELSDGALNAQGEALAHCYNCHEELLNTLRAMVVAYSGEHDLSAEDCQEAYYEAQIAIQKAEEKESNV